MVAWDLVETLSPSSKLYPKKLLRGSIALVPRSILTSYRDLGGAESLEKWQKLALFIGVMSVAMVWGAFFWIRRSMAAAPKTAPAGP